MPQERAERTRLLSRLLSPTEAVAMTAPALAPALPFEYRPGRPVPETVEVCRRCLGGLVFYRGAASTLPYCVKCAAEQAGIRYVREATA